MIRAEDMNADSLLTCVGGPLDGREMPVPPPDDTDEAYSDIYYLAFGFFCHKEFDENGGEILHWYCTWQQPDPARKDRWWNFYAYRGVHDEDTPVGEIINNAPVIGLLFPEKDG